MVVSFFDLQAMTLAVAKHLMALQQVATLA